MYVALVGTGFLAGQLNLTGCTGVLYSGRRSPSEATTGGQPLKEEEMLITTTPTIEGKQIVKYHGLVSGEAIMGANVFKDLFAGIRDIVGGRSGAYEEELRQAKDIAIAEMAEHAAKMGANAVVAVDLDYETITISGGGSMLMVSASGTAIVYE
jgi:uncharacterized protein YbjQ (UPF0145 family)